jgi:hypothetical protein
MGKKRIYSGHGFNAEDPEKLLAQDPGSQSILARSIAWNWNTGPKSPKPGRNQDQLKKLISNMKIITMPAPLARKLRNFLRNQDQPWFFTAPLCQEAKQ